MRYADLEAGHDHMSMVRAFTEEVWTVVCLVQAVVVTDPQLARALLRCKLLDKFSYQYLQLRAVRTPLKAPAKSLSSTCLPPCFYLPCRPSCNKTILITWPSCYLKAVLYKVLSKDNRQKSSWVTCMHCLAMRIAMAKGYSASSRDTLMCPQSTSR